MVTRYFAGDLHFGGPATYRIVVQGTITQRTVDQLGDLEITSTKRASQPEQTTIIIPIRDQAELSGLLDSLYGQHLSIIRVEVIAREDQPTDHDDGAQG